MVEKSGVEKSGSGKFMVEKSGVERTGVETWGWKSPGLHIVHKKYLPRWGFCHFLSRRGRSRPRTLRPGIKLVSIKLNHSTIFCLAFPCAPINKPRYVFMISPCTKQGLCQEFQTVGAVCSEEESQRYYNDLSDRFERAASLWLSPPPVLPSCRFRPCLVIFSTSTFMFCTKLKFRPSFWGAEQVQRLIGSKAMTQKCFS